MGAGSDPQAPFPTQIPMCLATSDRFNPVHHYPCPKTGRWGLGTEQDGRIDSSAQSLTLPQISLFLSEAVEHPTSPPPGWAAPRETCIVVYPSVGLLQGVSHTGALGWRERGPKAHDEGRWAGVRGQGRDPGWECGRWRTAVKGSREDGGIPSPQAGPCLKCLASTPFPGLSQRGRATHLGTGKARCYRAYQSLAVRWSGGSRSRIH